MKRVLAPGVDSAALDSACVYAAALVADLCGSTIVVVVTFWSDIHHLALSLRTHYRTRGAVAGH